MKKVVVYTKGYCPYCDRAKALLKQKGIPFDEISIEKMSDADREALLKRSGMRTVPQIFVEEGTQQRLIGGYTELAELDGQDGLASLK